MYYKEEEETGKYQNKYGFDKKLEFGGARIYKIDEYTKLGINWLYFPSVTTITSLLPNPKLEEFKQKVGIKESEEIARKAADRGTAMHILLEEFIIEYNKTHNRSASLRFVQESTPSKFKELGLSNEAISKGRKLFYNFYDSNRFLEDFKFVSGVEEPLFSVKHGYAGTSDCSYFTHNSIIIRDYKSSGREKTRDEIDAYYMQVAAYMHAYEEMYDLEVAKGQIMISNEKTGLQIFEINNKEKDIYLNRFLELLEQFNQSFNYEELYEFAARTTAWPKR
jgi:CRISPR/Cas system-associated exonuclease Cas4 (RecB family)